MDERFDNNGELNYYRATGNATLKSVTKMMMQKEAGKKRKANEPIHAALGADLDEDIMTTSSEGGVIRNRALLHYMACLACSNSETDKFDYDFVQSLLDGGANLNEAVDVHGQTIFHEVARSWNLDVANFLLRNGADVNQQDKYGRSPLHVCASADHCDMVEFLLMNGANIDSRSKGDDQTPLHFAAKNDATRSVTALLGFGANIDSLDSRGRTPLQVAAERSRSEAARVLIEEGASSCIYDITGCSSMTVLAEKLPQLALEALDQLHMSDTITRCELFYLNLLEEPRQKTETKKARTPFETAVSGRQFDILMHPVMQRLIDVKWQQYGRFGTILDLIINFIYAILFTAFAIGTPGEGEQLYLPLKSAVWRIFIGFLLIVFTAYQMYLQIKTTIKSREKQKFWMKWRIQQLKDDLQYCHPKWQEEKHIREEMKRMKSVPLLSTIDGWFFFDWFIIVIILVTIALNLSFFLVGSSSIKSAYTRVLSVLLILVWLRILKYLRPFPGIGTLVLILGATGGDFVNWGFFFMLLFIPFTGCFWIMFGAVSLNQVSGFAEVPRLIYTMLQISVGEDFNLDGIVDADAVMARLLSVLYIAAMVIVCLNILIAYLSNTFTSVYSHAVENTIMQRAINILNIEKFLTKGRLKKYFEYLRDNASPEVVSASAVDMSDKRTTNKAALELQKNFQKTHEILTERLKKKVGRGKRSTFDILLKDVRRLRKHQNDTVEDLRNIQMNLENLGKLLAVNIPRTFSLREVALKTVPRHDSRLSDGFEENMKKAVIPFSSVTRGKFTKEGSESELNDGDDSENTDDDEEVGNLSNNRGGIVSSKITTGHTSSRSDAKPKDDMGAQIVKTEDCIDDWNEVNNETSPKDTGRGKGKGRASTMISKVSLLRSKGKQRKPSSKQVRFGVDEVKVDSQDIDDQGNDGDGSTAQKHHDSNQGKNMGTRQHQPYDDIEPQYHSSQIRPHYPEHQAPRWTIATAQDVDRPGDNSPSSLVPYPRTGRQAHSNQGFEEDWNLTGSWDVWEKISVDSISL